MAKRKIIKIDLAKCNGCGLCIPNCREGAIKIIDGKARLISDSLCDGLGACIGHCPQGAITIEERQAQEYDERKVMQNMPHIQWPIQLTLVPAFAPYLQDADLLIAADCVPFTYTAFHQDLLKGKVLLVGCPKLDDLESYAEKITQILKINHIKSITYAHMAVPCCFGLVKIIKSAISTADKNIPFKEVIISIKGEELT